MSGFVYFIGALGCGSKIKIGHAVNPQSRMKQIQTWSPVDLVLLAAVPGDKRLERNIQDCFADCHSHGEWFLPTFRLARAIRELKDGAPVHEAIDLSDRRGNTLGNTQAATRAITGAKLGRRRVEVSA